MCKTVLLPGQWSNSLTAQPVGHHIWLCVRYLCLAGTDIECIQVARFSGAGALHFCTPDADVCAVMTAQRKADASACSWCRRVDTAGSRDVAQLERQVADLLAQLQVEQRSHQLTREVSAWGQQLL